MDVCVYTLGCKVNQYESGVMVAKLKKAGHNAFEGLKKADCYILNTCAVTAEAEKKSRQAVAKMVKLNPECSVYIVGCASQNNAAQFDRFPNVRFIKGVASKIDITDVIGSVAQKTKDIEELPTSYQQTTFAETVRTRQTIKIQEGCDNFCSYCLVPYLRGRSRSRSVDDIIAEAKSRDGIVNEIVLTGIDISSFGKDTGESLGGLIKRLSGLKARIRLGSLEANIIDDGFLGVLAENKNFCPHFHLSLQSGSDKVLKKMNRRYDRETYAQIVAKIRKLVPDVTITSDFIAGFPGETEEQFEETLTAIDEFELDYSNVAAYSPREKTVAAKWVDKYIPEDVKDARFQRLNKKIQENCLKSNLKFVGREMEVLVESFYERKGMFINTGKTRNNKTVHIPYDKDLTGQFVPVKISGAKTWYLKGEML